LGGGVGGRRRKRRRGRGRRKVERLGNEIEGKKEKEQKNFKIKIKFILPVLQLHDVFSEFVCAADSQSGRRRRRDGVGRLGRRGRGGRQREREKEEVEFFFENACGDFVS